ncbi:hypothetical protein DENSPDRAFT_840782 [Dentipellis sp. KUC8613]|nr:hypothetical protein DENSPDRAFT_840782 [Dentipellis sp. KUC8613]
MSSALSPAHLWRWYVDHLVNYEPTSWVASTVYTFRVLAFLMILPTILLMLLDVTSYVIARTLGDTSAFTSDKSDAGAAASAPPTTTTTTTTNTDTTTDTAVSPADVALPPTPPAPPTIVIDRAASLSVPAFDDEESVGAQRLAGVGVFSPASSRPPSPTVTRKGLPREEAVREEAEEREERRNQEDWQGTWSSANGSVSGESFAMLEREEGFEESEVEVDADADPDAGVLRMRTGKRVRGEGEGAGAQDDS